MDIIEYKWKGKAQKPFEELNAAELTVVQERVQQQIRERAWAVGSPVYYVEKGILVAAYKSGKRIVVEEIHGELVETREYEGRE